MVTKKAQKALEEKRSFVGDQKVNSFSRSANKPLSSLETNEAQFWTEVAEKSESLIANLIESILPICAVPEVFNLEKDVDYRVLLRDDLPNFYQDQEEYLAKIESGNWTEADVEYVAEDLTCQYFEIVVRSLIERLSDYQGFETTSLTNLGGI